MTDKTIIPARGISVGPFELLFRVEPYARFVATLRGDRFYNIIVGTQVAVAQALGPQPALLRGGLVRSPFSRYGCLCDACSFMRANPRYGL